MYHPTQLRVKLLFIYFPSIGSILGILSNQFYQEKAYRYVSGTRSFVAFCPSNEILSWTTRNNVATRGPEARLYAPMIAAVAFPAAMFMFAWCTFPDIHWIALAIAITVCVSSFTLLYDNHLMASFRLVLVVHVGRLHYLSRGFHLLGRLVSWWFSMNVLVRF